MEDFKLQKWFDLYETAMLELERAAMTGRIAEARAEIGSRLEVLQQHPALYPEERQAIEGSLSNLRVLEREEARLGLEDKKRLLRDADSEVPNSCAQLNKSEM